MEKQELRLGQPQTRSPAPQRAPWDGQGSPTKSPQLASCLSSADLAAGAGGLRKLRVYQRFHP